MPSQKQSQATIVVSVATRTRGRGQQSLACLPLSPASAPAALCKPAVQPAAAQLGSKRAQLGAACYGLVTACGGLQQLVTREPQGAAPQRDSVVGARTGRASARQQQWQGRSA